jgi:DNA-binding MarR family transcriptional regulator
LPHSALRRIPVGMSGLEYALDDQIGYLLRRVSQRHLAIFARHIPHVTTTQFAVLARLAELGAQSQNALGRETAMDAATIKGVVDRLARQGLVATVPDTADRRRLSVDLTADGRAVFDKLAPLALEVSWRTLEPLSEAESAQLTRLLLRLT